MQIGNYRIGTLSKRVGAEVLDDNVLGLSAQTAYYFFFSLFPLMLFLTPLFSLVGDKAQFVNFLMEQFGRALPPESFQLFRDIVSSVVYSDTAPGLMSIGAVLALWTGSNVFNSLIGALNRAYDVDETRPWWKSRLIAIAMVLLSGVAIMVATITLMAGDTIVNLVANLVGLDDQTALVITIVQYAVALLFLFGVAFLTYLILPNTRQKKRTVLVAAAFATVLWVAVTLLFRWYVVNFANYNKTYGTIGGIIVMLTWMYLSMLVLLVGGELASELHKGTGQVKTRGGTLYGSRISTGGETTQGAVAPSIGGRT